MSEISRLKDCRLGIFADSYAKNSFVLRTAEIVFARVNQINGKWCVWFYRSHLQKNFDRLRDALTAVDDNFKMWYRDNKR